MGDNADLVEQWHEQFNFRYMLRFGIRTCGRSTLGYTIWATCCHLTMIFFPLYAEQFADAATLRILTFLVGLLLSMMLGNALSVFKQCFAACLDFQAEMRSFWYFVQARIGGHDEAAPARFITDCHMIAFSLSCCKAIMANGDNDHRDVYDAVHLEFRQCCLLSPDDDTYSVVTSDPAIMELVMWSWLRVLGRVDYEACVRWAWVRTKLDTMLTAQFMHPPDTTVHLMQFVTHLLLIVLPMSCTQISSKLVTPGISFVLLALLAFSEDLQHPLGVGGDKHHLPWFRLFRTVSQCRVAPHQKPLLRQAIGFFNQGCHTNSWDEEEAKVLFGEKASIGRDLRKRMGYNTGEVQLGIYMTEPLLRSLDAVGGRMFPEVLRGDITRNLPNIPESWKKAEKRKEEAAEEEDEDDE